jgi:hypothetical protein
LRAYLPAVLIVLIANLVAEFHHPIRSLEGELFDQLYRFALSVAVLTLLCELMVLAVAWLEFRRLLVALNALPLRRGFEPLEGFSWKPIWRLRGGVLHDSLQMASREVQSLRNLQNTLFGDEIELREVIRQTVVQYERLTCEYEEARCDKNSQERTKLMAAYKSLQDELAETCGAVLLFLSRQWQRERQSEFKHPNQGNSRDRDTEQAEHFVCLAYVNFILSILMRMRTLVMTVGGLFVFILLSVNSYPFEPKQTLRTLMVILFLIIVTVVAVIYGQMHRDSTLSRITNTKPGELGGDFWIRLAAFVAVPLLSLLVAQYSEINNFLFSWLQPALESLK